MTRRAAAGLARLLPLLLITAAAIIVLGAALLAACGGSSGGSSSPQPTATVTVTAGPRRRPPGSPPRHPPPPPRRPRCALYFLRGEKLGVAERRVQHTTMPATAAMKALLAGPSASEQAAGLGSAIPAGTRLLGLTIAGDDGARRPLRRVRLGRRQPLDDGARRAGRVHAHPVPDGPLGRVPAWTASRCRGARRRGPHAGRRAAPRRLARLRAAIFVESPGVGAVARQPVHPHRHGERVRRLLHRAARRLVRAARRQHAPSRPRGARPAADASPRRSPSPPRRAGTLIVYDQIMEDGSRQDEVRIPVTFAAD